MLSRIMVSLVMAAAMIIAPVRLSARSCILSNASSEKACQLNCCANQTCCATSPKNTAPVSQPLVKSGSTSDLNATAAAILAGSLPVDAPEIQHVGLANAFGAHAPPTLALICIRLI